MVLVWLTMPETMPVTKFYPSKSLHNVRLGHNCITLENAASAPPSDLHNHTLCNSSPSQVPRCRPSQIVKEQSRHSSLFTCFCPSSSKIPDRLTIRASEDERCASFAEDAHPDIGTVEGYKNRLRSNSKCSQKSAVACSQLSNVVTKSGSNPHICPVEANSLRISSYSKRSQHRSIACP